MTNAILFSSCLFKYHLSETITELFYKVQSASN